MFSDPPQKRRWPRSQRFTLSAAGREAESAYRTTIVASRAEEGRGSFDTARAEWAKALGIEPDDGVYLCEISAGPVRLENVVEALDSCGKTRQDAVAALGRLFDAGLVATAG